MDDHDQVFHAYDVSGLVDDSGVALLYGETRHRLERAETVLRS
jgi:hypothetical protein